MTASGGGRERGEGTDRDRGRGLRVSRSNNRPSKDWLVERISDLDSRLTVMFIHDLNTKRWLEQVDGV